MSSKNKSGFLTSAKNRLKKLLPSSRPPSRPQSPSLDQPRGPPPSSSHSASASPAPGANDGDTGGNEAITLPLGPSDTMAPSAPAPVLPSNVYPKPTIALIDPHHTKDTPEDVQDEPKRSKMDIALDYLGVAGSLATMLMKRVPDFIDGNPVTMAFGLANTIIEISGAVKGNKSAVEQQVVWTSAQLLIVQKSLAEWTGKNAIQTGAMKSFEEKIAGQLQRLVELKKQCLFRRIATHEDLQDEIGGIFAQVNQAREELLLGTGLKIHQIVYTMKETLKKSLFRDLKPATMANFKYYVESGEDEALRRNVCTPNTRVHILDNIKSWSKDNSATSPSVYWLFGSAGSGKSTVAYTIATETSKGTGSTALGGNFFCSRQFESTRQSKRIIPTIVYDLARQCPSFADALAECDFDVVEQIPTAQFEELLAKPWLQSAPLRASNPYSPLSYLVIIDALDEIEGDGGPAFLRGLFAMINAQQLPGLKFLITSRPDYLIVDRVNTFSDKELYRLEEIPVDEAEADIKTYLEATFPHLKGHTLLHDLTQLAAGLFIFAATVAKEVIIEYPAPDEQQQRLEELIKAMATQAHITMSSSATKGLDRLYIQVLERAFKGLATGPFGSRLRILHTLLCTAERTSTTVATRLAHEDHIPASTAVADDVVKRLYSVLYIENGKVFTYHKSFSDFIFDHACSGAFWCDQPPHHHLIAGSCLRLMNTGLRFNIANIPSSYVLDKDNPALQDEDHLARSIPSDLRYACRYWAYHLKATGSRNDNTSLIPSLATFIKLPALFWIEAMSILGLVGLCDSLFQTAYDFIPPENPLLQKAFAGAANFALYFSTSAASHSTPHLYISALSTFPDTTHPVSEWKSHFPAIPQFTSNQHHVPSLMAISVGGFVTSIAISSNGELLAHDFEDDVQIRHASTGRLHSVLKGHSGIVYSVSFARNGAYLLSSSRDNTVRIWEVETGRQIHILEGHSGTVFSVAISPDGTRVASGSKDKSVRIWDAWRGELLHVLEVHTGAVYSVVFSHSPPYRICSGARDGSVCVWDIDGRLLWGGPGSGHTQEGRVCEVAFSPDSRTVSLGTLDGTIQMRDALTGEELATLRDDRITEVVTVAFSPDGSKIASGGPNCISIWDVGTRQIVGFLGMAGHRILSVAFLLDGKRLAAASMGAPIRVWDMGMLIEAASHTQDYSGLDAINLRHQNNAHWVLAASHDGTKVVTGRKGILRVHNVQTGVTLFHTDLGHTSRVLSVAFSNDDSEVISVFDTGRVKLYDFLTGATLMEKDLGTEIVCASISFDGGRIIVGNLEGGYVWDVLRWEANWIWTLETTTKDASRVTAVALSENGKYAGMGLESGKALVWDLGTGQQKPEVIWELEGLLRPVMSMQFSSDTDCSRLACCFEWGDIQLWDMGTGHCMWVVPEHTLLCQSIAFSDSAICASTSSEGAIHLWDTKIGGCQDVLLGSPTPVTDVVFQPHTGEITSVSADGSIRVWNLTPAPAKAPLYNLEENREESVPVRTGWLLSRDSKNLLMCGPVDDMVPDPRNTLVIPSTAASSVSFSGAKLGPDWQNCYSNTSSSLK